MSGKRWEIPYHPVTLEDCAAGNRPPLLEAVLALRELHPDVTLEAAIPCASQADRWAAADRERYKTLLACCDEQHLVQQGYSPNCMQRRNEYMVDHSALLLAAFAGLPGGTMNTILYAQRSGVETVVIGI